jgi:hypothetical protein
MEPPFLSKMFHTAPEQIIYIRLVVYIKIWTKSAKITSMMIVS